MSLDKTRRQMIHQCLDNVNSHLSTKTFIILFSLAVFLASCNQQSKNDNPESKDATNFMMSQMDLTPPNPKILPQNLEAHGDVRVDNYYWMKLSDEQKMAAVPDSQTQEVLDYLNAENAYREKVMAGLKPLEESLYKEIVARIKQDDSSVPYFLNGYWYVTKFEEGKEYAIRSRKKGSLDAADELLLDENALAKGHSYYATAGRNISPNNQILAYGEDTLSRRKYNIKFIDLSTGKYLTDVIPNTTGGIVWANDNKTVFYTQKDAALRSYKIFRHELGTSVAKDVEVFHEKDETFSTFVFKSKSKKYIIIGSSTTVSNEYLYVDADKPTSTFTIFQPRVRDLEYSINHINGKWYIRTNKDGAQNFKVMTAEEGATGMSNWKDFGKQDPEILVEGIELFDKYMVVSERVKGITQLKVQAWEGGEPHYVNFGEDAFTAYASVNPEASSETLRIEFTSMTTPSTTYDYNMSTKKLEMKKQEEVLGGFDKNNYQSERVYVKARDGKEIPLSIVYKKGFKKDGSQPVLLYGYGSYGYSTDPSFNSENLSLLDRGFAFAIAHIRGGEDLGRPWYYDGKLLKKKNTFYDFIDCGDFLVNKKYTSKDALFAMGGSAGGLLTGAVVNLRPDLWKGVIVAVPFVDVVTTMLDESIPLTTGEFDEWGNPKQKEYYDYMKSYSPYDNIEKKDYPALFVTTGYHDSQVQYWEPAKYVAKLRAYKTNNNPLLLYCNMEVGHGGASGRFERYKETAMEFAFILDLAGIAK